MSPLRDRILERIRNYVETHHGDVPGERTFAAFSGVKPSAWKGRYWARWTDAVREAGYHPNTVNRKIDDQRLIEALAEFAMNLGRFPIREEIDLHARSRPGFPVWRTFKKRFGGMPQTAAALLDYSRQHGNDFLESLCRKRLAAQRPPAAAQPARNNNCPERTGYVYLKYSPSLRLYKIGKADDAHKRGAGLSLLLPEDLVSKHEIQTDQPFLIEKYWHTRFKEQRKQGEWFDLDSADVAAFKSRREFLFCEYFP